jgi:hypothetical protein
MAFNIIHTPSSCNALLANELADKDEVDVLRHLLGFALASMPTLLDQAVIVYLDFEWW